MLNYVLNSWIAAGAEILIGAPIAGVLWFLNQSHKGRLAVIAATISISSIFGLMLA